MIENKQETHYCFLALARQDYDCYSYSGEIIQVLKNYFQDKFVECVQFDEKWVIYRAKE